MRTNQNHGTRITKRSEEKGFTILEVMVAICILTVGLLGVASMQSASIIGNSLASDLTEGTTWASDQLETLIRLGATNYDDTDNLADENSDGAAGLNDTGADADNSFTQGDYTISWNVVENLDVGNTKTVNVIVSWTDHGVQKKVSIRHVIPDMT